MTHFNLLITTINHYTYSSSLLPTFYFLAEKESVCAFDGVIVIKMNLSEVYFLRLGHPDGEICSFFA